MGVNSITALKLSAIVPRTLNKLVRQSQIVQSVMYSYDAVISSYIIPAIHSWFGRSASEKVVFLRRFLLVLN